MNDNLEEIINKEYLERGSETKYRLNHTYYNGLKKELGEYFSSSIALINAGNPIWSVIETQIVGFSPNESYNLKVRGTVACLLGLGYLGNGIRNAYQKTVGVNEKTSKKMMLVHDSIVGAICSLLIGTPFLYMAGGVDDPWTLAKSLLVSTLANIPIGAINGYSIDLHKDLLGVKKSERVPEFIHFSPGYLKKSSTLGISLASAAVTYTYLKMIGL